jgi:hypothetical protein
MVQLLEIMKLIGFVIIGIVCLGCVAGLPFVSSSETVGKNTLSEVASAEAVLSRLNYSKFLPSIVPNPLFGSYVFNTSYGLYGWRENSFAYRFRDGETLVRKSSFVVQVQIKNVWFETLCSSPQVVAKFNRYNFSFSATINGTIYGTGQIIATYGLEDMPKVDLMFQWRGNSQSFRWVWKVLPSLTFVRVLLSATSTPLVPISGQLDLGSLKKVALSNLTDYYGALSTFYLGVDWESSGYSANVTIGVDPVSGDRGLIMAFPEKEGFIDPYVVSLTNRSGATTFNPQKRVFNAQGLDWSWFAQNISGSYYGVFATSSDNGVTWSSTTTFRTISAQAQEFSVASNGTHIAYVYSRGTSYGDDLFYRLAVLNANATITWVDSEQTVYDCSSIVGELRERITKTGIVFDSSGKNWIFCSFYEYYQPLYSDWIFENDDVDGTWSSSSPNYPYEVQAGAVDISFPYHILVPLTGGDMYDVFPFYLSSKWQLNGTRWDGSSWTSDDNICSTEELAGGNSLFTISSVGDNIYLVFNRIVINVYYLRHKCYSGTAWETNSRTVVQGVNSTSSPVVCVNSLNASAYCFWIGNATTAGSNVVFYKKWNSSLNSWDTDPTQFVVEGTIGLMTSLTSAWNFDYTLGVLYTNGTGTNYWVKWEYIIDSIPVEERSWYYVTWMFNLVTRQWSYQNRTFDLITRQWNYQTWMFDLITRQWSYLTWMFDLVTRSSHYQYLTFDLVTRDWNYQTWVFDLITREWNYQYLTFDLSTRAWSFVSWMFELTQRTWNYQYRTFDLPTRQWSFLSWSFELGGRFWNFQVWTFELTKGGGFNVAVWVSLSMVGFVGLVYLMRRRKKVKEQ